MTAPSNDYESRLSRKARRTVEPPISWLMRKTLEGPEMISLAAGFVDQDSLPAGPMKELIDHICADPVEAKKALQYGSTAGLLDLRIVLARKLEKLGLKAPVHQDNIVITNGSQQLLYLITDVLVDEGDIVLVEDPTYFVYMGTLDAAGARTVGIPTDDHGMIPEALVERLEEIRKAGELHRVKMLYVMPFFQNPKGTSHTWHRCQQIMEIVERYSTPENYIYILEDSAYFDLQFEGPAMPLMKTLDPANERIITALTFSKGFAPGLRLGYGYLPPSLVGPVCNQKGNHDFGSGNFAQHIILRALATGVFDKQGEYLRTRYREKRDVMMNTIREEFPEDVSVIEPHGGLYVWTTMPDGMNTDPESEFFAEAMERRVLYVPGCYCYAQEEGRTKPKNQIRLCYGYIEEDPMVEGLRRLGAVIKACLK